MSRTKTYKESKDTGRDAIAEHGAWLNGVSGIVADNNDPEKQHRVRVIIPSIDESLIFDEWARQMVFCLGNGYGSVFIPPKGSEVVLFGQLGQKFNLFYASLYNEEMLVPDGFQNEMTVGIKAPGNLTFIAEELAKIQAKNFDAIIAQTAKILAQNIESNASQLNKILGNQVRIEGSQIRAEGNQIQLQGSTITINANGSITIQGNSVQISGSSVKIHNRIVNPVGPPI
ncbi:MAG TPA: phage baseplate assembly protein V [Pyrinomonadaceae bacterium]|nr:phage baseplate assembly protein V [Pyrinomonadaceae bacterium]